MVMRSRLVLLCAVLALAGCSGTTEALGLGRNPPDEFAVVDRPPLSMPPDFDLKPPRPGAPRPQEVSMPGRANSILFGSDKENNTASEVSPVEKAVLASAGADKADPTIRDRVDRETAQIAVGSRHLVEDVLWWKEPPSAATTVDSAAEAERIKNAKEKGEPLTQGPTPIIEKDKGGWLGL